MSILDYKLLLFSYLLGFMASHFLSYLVSCLVSW
jgi:hypothetical protein